MQALDSAVKVLGERGISAFPRPDGSLHCSRGQDLSLMLSVESTGFRVRCWETAPGPGSNDFDVRFLTLDEALLAIWCFYCSSSVIMGDWVVPLHRRPFWPLAKIQYSLANLVHVSAQQFEAIQETRRRRVLLVPGARTVGLEFAEVTQFLVCDHVHDSGKRLMVRRDLEEAYVVDET